MPRGVITRRAPQLAREVAATPRPAGRDASRATRLARRGRTAPVAGPIGCAGCSGARPSSRACLAARPGTAPRRRSRSWRSVWTCLVSSPDRWGRHQGQHAARGPQGGQGLGQTRKSDGIEWGSEMNLGYQSRGLGTGTNLRRALSPVDRGRHSYLAENDRRGAAFYRGGAVTEHKRCSIFRAHSTRGEAALSALPAWRARPPIMRPAPSPGTDLGRRFRRAGPG